MQTDSQSGRQTGRQTASYYNSAKDNSDDDMENIKPGWRVVNKRIFKEAPMGEYSGSDTIITRKR